MDIKTIEIIAWVLCSIFAVLFILLVCVLPAICIREKEKQANAIRKTYFPKLREQHKDKGWHQPPLICL